MCKEGDRIVINGIWHIILDGKPLKLFWKKLNCRNKKNKRLAAIKISCEYCKKDLLRKYPNILKIWLP